jgi:acetyl-CoA acyltransferase
MQAMPEAVIIDGVRSGIGKRNGALSGVHPADLSGYILQALAARTGLDPAAVDDVMWGCVNQVGDQAAQIGRYGVLAAGWPDTVPASTINRACGSSQQAIDFAAAMIRSGQCDVAVAGGV